MKKIIMEIHCQASYSRGISRSNFFLVYVFPNDENLPSQSFFQYFFVLYLGSLPTEGENSSKKKENAIKFPSPSNAKKESNLIKLINRFTCIT